MLRVVLLLALVGCGKGGEREHPAGHDHGHGEPVADEPPAVAATVWTERSELFVEYPALIAGAETRFHAHVTVLAGFRALEQGQVVAVLTQADGKEVRGQVDQAVRSGIFGPAVTPTAAGPCRLRFLITGPEVQDEIVLPACTVHPDLAAARKANPEEEAAGGRISYLKEDQWTSPFATQPAAERDLQDGVHATGEVRPVAGRHAVIAAPASGRLTVSAGALVIGSPITAGQTLATLAPRLVGADRASLAADVAAGDAELTAARTALERARRLLADRAGSQSELDEAQARFDVALARRDGARGRLAQYQAGISGSGRGSVPIQSPLAGTLVVAGVASGQSIEEGQTLFEVMDLSSVWIVANVFEHDLGRIAGATSARVRVPGRADELVAGKLVTIGRVLDPQTRTAPVIFELTDATGTLRIGQTVDVLVATGEPRRALAVPEAALLDDAGRAVVFVMVEGEAFERRVVRTGARSGGFVEVLGGVEPGERVVTEGAYDIKLASSTGAIPAHGHAH